MHLIPSRPPPLFFLKMRKVVNYVFWASTLQGSYLCPFWSKFKKLHEVWKVFFKGNNLRPSATPYFNLFRSYSSTKAIIKSCPIWHLKKQICLKSSNIPFSTSQVSNAQYSHSRIFYLDFSWNTTLSIENRWGPSGARRGPFSAWKRQT